MRLLGVESDLPETLVVFAEQNDDTHSLNVEGTGDVQLGLVDKVNDLVVGTVPYILPKDMLIFKIYRCGIRAVALKRTRDAVDGEKLVEELTSAGPICLSAQQTRIANSQLAELANGVIDPSLGEESTSCLEDEMCTKRPSFC